MDDAELERALALLMAGRYAEAWPLYEKRPLARLPFPPWRGDDLAGKRLLVWSEQGLGDAIMCARYFPMLAERGAEVRFVCPPPLVRVLGGLGAEIIPHSFAVALPPMDLSVHLFSLPHRFGTSLETIPPPAHIRVTPRRIGSIGVKWRGNPAHNWDTHRSLPQVQAGRLLSLPGAFSLEPEDTGAADFRDTAEVIAGADLVISVDTATAHLAGSLGVPTWILLSQVGLDWRWMTDRRDSPWYPSVTLYRQPSPGDWNSVIDEILAQLSAPISATKELRVARNART